ncbi:MULTISPECIES: hypothetical protein [Streptomycetaceae]|uniref:hypothetical protein n=1 Tax=Streptomycetaceae TaxID=2062 RepID=UPI00093A82F5|nr:hypothetical protein [Streptomyces sp. CB02056]
MTAARPRRPSALPLTATERTRLDHLVRRAADRLGPDEAGTLHRLWERDRADRAQERRSAGGARAAAQRTADRLRSAEAEAAAHQAALDAVATKYAATAAELRRSRAAHRATVAEARRQARRATGATAVLRAVAEQLQAVPAPGRLTADQIAVDHTEAAALVRLHLVVEDAGLDLGAELDRIAPALTRSRAL